jgi:hypothetical protein
VGLLVLYLPSQVMPTLNVVVVVLAIFSAGLCCSRGEGREGGKREGVGTVCLRSWCKGRRADAEAERSQPRQNSEPPSPQAPSNPQDLASI